MNTNQFHPGQLLRATTDFNGYILASPTSCKPHIFRTGDMFLLISIVQGINYGTIALINTGELIVSEWWFEPFLQDDNLLAEPVETT